MVWVSVTVMASPSVPEWATSWGSGSEPASPSPSEMMWASMSTSAQASGSDLAWASVTEPGSQSVWASESGSATGSGSL